MKHFLRCKKLFITKKLIPIFILYYNMKNGVSSRDSGGQSNSKYAE